VLGGSVFGRLRVPSPQQRIYIAAPRDAFTEPLSCVPASTAACRSCDDRRLLPASSSSSSSSSRKESRGRKREAVCWYSSSHGE